MGFSCPRCESTAIEEEKGASVCSVCGFVVMDGGLSTDVQANLTWDQDTGRPHGRLVKLDSPNEIALENSALAEKLNLPLHVRQEAKALGAQVMKLFEGKCLPLTNLNVLLGGCIYCSCRLNHFPCLLDHIADMIPCKKKELSDVARMVQETLQLKLPAHNLSEWLRKTLIILNDSENVALKMSSSQCASAQSLLRFCDSSFITTGRKGLPIIVAVIYLSLKDKGDQSLEEVAEVLQNVMHNTFSFHTVKQRVQDIESRFLELKGVLLSSKELHTLPCLPQLASGTDMSVTGYRSEDIPDSFVMEWIENLQESEDRAREALESSPSDPNLQNQLSDISTLLSATISSGRKRKTKPEDLDKQRQVVQKLKRLETRSSDWMSCIEKKMLAQPLLIEGGEGSKKKAGKRKKKKSSTAIVVPWKEKVQEFIQSLLPDVILERRRSIMSECRLAVPSGQLDEPKEDNTVISDKEIDALLKPKNSKTWIDYF
mmetsp:Transcript_9695/g.18246  ORF Transcript_9695/g.18246 Transcript_9695/m.18246 type:complete len:486 (-) Transcript_9695:100-1557(-)